MTDATETRADPGLRTVVAASATGTAFEWYDFFVFGALATVIARHFFADAGETVAYILALLTFGLGFVVRPLGALVFGWFGDRTGRKTTFLVTITLMGVATVAIGLLPDYDQIGIAAPILLLVMRMLQGFALGGEYGGAVVYVAEHAPAKKRGLMTGWIQTTAALGLIGALSVILMGVAATFIARLLQKHRWIAYVGLLIIFYVALKMMWDGYLQVQACNPSWFGMGTEMTTACPLSPDYVPTGH